MCRREIFIPCSLVIPTSATYNFKMIHSVSTGLESLLKWVHQKAVELLGAAAHTTKIPVYEYIAVIFVIIVLKNCSLYKC